MIGCRDKNCPSYFHVSCYTSTNNGLCNYHLCQICEEKGTTHRCVRCTNGFHSQCLTIYGKRLGKKYVLCNHPPQPWTSITELKSKVVNERRFIPVQLLPGYNNATYYGSEPSDFNLPTLFVSHVRQLLYKDKVPPPYEKINKCIYLTSSYCEPADEKCNCKSKCGNDCLNRMLQIECTSKLCDAVDCTNRNFATRNDAKIKIAYTGPGRGFGAFADSDIKMNDFICEYVGEVIDAYEVQSRLEKAKANGTENFYIFELSADVLIDAQNKGSRSRFLNHSCDPNCYSQKWIVGNTLRVGLFALKNISKECELTYDYHFESFWDENNQKPCNCGGKTCTGIFGVKKGYTSKVGRDVN